MKSKKGNKKILKSLKDNLIKEKENKEEHQEETVNLIDKPGPKNEEQNLTDYQIIKKSFKITNRYWELYLTDFIHSTLKIVFDILLPLSKANLIDTIKGNNIELKALINNLKKLLIMYLVRLILYGILNIFERLFATEKHYELKNLFLRDVVNKDIEFFDKHKSGEILERINSAYNTLDDNLLFKASKYAVQIIKFISLIIVLFYKSFIIALVTVIAFIFKSIGDYLILNFTDIRNRAKWNDFKTIYSADLTEFITNIRLTKSFGTEERELKKLKEINMQTEPLYGGLRGFMMRLGDFCEGFVESMIIFFCGYCILKKKITLGGLFIFQGFIKEVRGTYEHLRSEYHTFKLSVIQWRRFFEYYDYKPKVINNEVNLSEANNIKIKGKVTFEDVSFAYPLKPDVLVLNKISFDLLPGKVTAVVGYSGGGKTTIANLILRFYDINGGNIFIDDRSIKDYNISFLRRSIGYVSQEPTLYSGTIKDNIYYGVNVTEENKKYYENKFKEVCEMANVENFVNDKVLFPQGYDSNVGEKGSKISGGQKQRIAIARALMKNVNILIFDEATSSLDAKSESEVQNAIDRITKNKEITILIIAHRLSTIKDADKIIFINKGKVLEQGTHDELIKLNKNYKDLVEKQLISKN